MEYLNDLATQLGVSLWLLIVIFIWSSVWKFLALWKSARKSNIAWFIVFALVNTIGVLEILYIYVFSERDINKTKDKNQEKPTKKKRKK